MHPEDLEPRNMSAIAARRGGDGRASDQFHLASLRVLHATARPGPGRGAGGLLRERVGRLGGGFTSGSARRRKTQLLPAILIVIIVFLAFWKNVPILRLSMPVGETLGAGVSFTVGELDFTSFNRGEDVAHRARSLVYRESCFE